MKNTCGNCKFFDENKTMVNGSHPCNFLGLTTKHEQMGCYLIQKFKIRNKEYKLI